MPLHRLNTPTYLGGLPRNAVLRIRVSGPRGARTEIYEPPDTAEFSHSTAYYMTYASATSADQADWSVTADLLDRHQYDLGTESVIDSVSAGPLAVEVTSVLQTSAGRMIFARFVSVAEGAGDAG